MRILFVLLMFVFALVKGAWSDVYGGDKYIATDVVIDYLNVYSPDTLRVCDSIVLENNGLLKTKVFVQDGVILFIENHADVNSIFNLGVGAQIIQKVSDADDMNKIDFNVPYSVLVEDADMLHWDDLLSFADGANKIILEDSVLNIDGTQANSVNNIELRGDVFLVVDSIDELHAKPFINSVSGTGTVHVVSVNSNPLFVDAVVVRDGDLYFERSRELDYEKVFNNDMGRFLNLIRIKNPNDKLLYTLDSVDDIDSFNRVLNHSARFNSEILARPLRILNAMNTLNYFDGVSAGGWGVMSDDFYSYGIGAALLENVLPTLELGVRVSAGEIDYDGLYDIYSADLFGVDLLAVWSVTGDVILRGRGGALYEYVNIGDVFYDNKIYENPAVFLGYVQADVGYDYNLSDLLGLNVYLGAKAEVYSVADISSDDLNLYSGVDISYEFEMHGINYDYVFGVEVNADSDIGMHVGVGFMSDMDMMGGNANLSVMRMFDVMTYKLSLNARFLF